MTKASLKCRGLSGRRTAGRLWCYPPSGATILATPHQRLFHKGETLFICNPNRPLRGTCRIMKSIIINFLVCVSKKEYQFGGYLFCTVNLKSKRRNWNDLWIVKPLFLFYFFSPWDMSANILIILPLKINLKFQIDNDFLICIPSFTWVLEIAWSRCEILITDFHAFCSAAAKKN